MKTLIRRDFISWSQKGFNVRAVALVDEIGWFQMALNAMRDGSMEEGDVWYGDSANIYGEDEYDYRPASPSEVDLYLSHCSCQWEDDEIVAVVRGRESYVLYSKKSE